MKQLLKYYSVCLLYLLDFSNGCELPTDSNPISVCAFCSENHTGVRWMVHSSHDDRHFFDSKRIDTINIDFQCQDPQGNNIMINHDDCFDGSRLPYVGSVPSSEWRWYIMEWNLSQGTECSFTTTLFNHLYHLKRTLETTTCTVGDCFKAGDCGTSPFPAVCSGGGEPGDSVCSCSCSDGFSGSVGRAGGLLCRNIDECASGAHRCGHIDNCRDAEGGHECLHEPSIATSADVPITTTSSSTDYLPTTTATPVQIEVTTTPADTGPLSVHAFCSDKHAGVKWMVHESNVNRAIYDPETVDTIDIKFECQTPEGNVISHDDCFDGGRLPSVYHAIKAGEWRWYTLEREMSVGTQCNFTTMVQNTLLGTWKTLGTSTCSVKSSLECSDARDCGTSPFPAVCSGGREPGDSVCSCSCSDGFSGSIGRAGGLLCRNIDECSLGTHHCGDIGNCVDTEGGYNCLSAQPTIIDPTTIARVSTPGIMTHSTTLSTSITAVGTKTTSSASTSASADVLQP